MPGACFGARVRAGAVPAPGESRHSDHKGKGHLLMAFVFLLLARLEKGTSAARETCRGHVSMPVCVPAQCLRRASLATRYVAERSRPFPTHESAVIRSQIAALDFSPRFRYNGSITRKEEHP